MSFVFWVVLSDHHHGVMLLDNILRVWRFWSMFLEHIWGSRVGISLRGSSVWVCLVVLNQGCCGSGQFNLPDRMLRLDANTTLNQSYILFITLVNITCQNRDQYLLSIYSWDSGPWQVLYTPLSFFLNFSPGFCFNCFSVVFVSFKRCKPNQFLVLVINICSV